MICGTQLLTVFSKKISFIKYTYKSTLYCKVNESILKLQMVSVAVTGVRVKRE